MSSISSPPLGINRGYLFGIGTKPYKDHVYVTSPNAPFDPFTNPHLCKAFDASQVIVSEFEGRSNEQEVVEFFQLLPERLQKALSPEQLQSLKKTLAPLLEKIPALRRRGAYENLKAQIESGQNDAAATAALAFFGIFQTVTAERNHLAELAPEEPSSDDGAEQRLKQRALLSSKQVVPLFSSEETPKIEQVLSLLFEEPELLCALLFCLTTPEFGTLLSETSRLERGDYEVSDDFIPDMTRLKLMRSLFSSAQIDWKKLEKSPALHSISDLLSFPKRSPKIASFVTAARCHLLVISRHTLTEWPHSEFPLTQIKTRLKPIGFFWTLQAGGGHQGTLMGSMHITAEKLVNFPRRILERFDASEAIAVEIDVTREEVVKRCREEARWELAQAKELAQLSPDERETLFLFFKQGEPHLEAAPMDPFDAKTSFLLAALKKMALQRFKTTFSEARDRSTHQSFDSTGIEKVLIERAKAKRIPIKDLETFEEHFSGRSSSYLPTMPPEALRKLTELSHKPLEEIVGLALDNTSGLPRIQSRDDLWEYLQPHPLQKMTDMMERGDLEALEVSYLAEDDSKERAQLIERNGKMAERIEAYMKSGQKHFCIAGAMHMAGPFGLVPLLRKRGYSVQRLVVEEPLDLDDDEKAPSSPPIGEIETFPSDPINPPIVSLEPHWSDLPLQLFSQAAHLLSWPWRRNSP